LGISGETNPEGRKEKLTHNTDNWFKEHGKTGGDNTTSIFDPALCELMYKWFCPKDGQIVDPFAGGSVRGIVAHLLDYKYWGCDLRQEQIDANYEQAEKITPDDKPIWITGDVIDKLQEAPKADFIFSCPPYGDLEKYSDNKRDLSNMEYHTFIAAMKRVVLRCYKRLKDNSFACFVVGDFRDKQGFYRNFISDTISCFLDNKFKLYNEIILVTVTGSLPIRMTKQFNAARKIGKTHQNILIFAKGNPKIATKKIKGE
jgi:DNA modification methylase